MPSGPEWPGLLFQLRPWRRFVSGGRFLTLPHLGILNIIIVYVLTSALPVWTAPPWCCSSPCRWRPRRRSRCSQVQNCCKAQCPGPPLQFTFIHDMYLISYQERGWHSIMETCLPMSAPYTVTGLPSWALTLVQCSEMFIITWWGEENNNHLGRIG